ncbi:ABC transporter ATP-binding protein [Jongsikchunia kroppenstedtii]|uniref:ABC transporter ATP-binding protein n=1 Tax=Jongsikchunia kroppenstedtii TaxID=1121721 RepID=UPI0003718843|nr:ABC transporter ATP-binding protein [Jongsikchunia kroppenstedtii]
MNELGNRTRNDARITAQPTAAVEISGLRKSFRSTAGAVVDAVRGITLTIEPGEVVAILGPNGAGKTTTIDMLLGLSRPDSGSVRLYGVSPEQAAAAGRVAAVTQTGGLLPDFTVSESARIIASAFGVVDQVPDALAAAGIAELADRKVSKCSGGEQQRLKFALALLPDPDLIVLDEPTAGMDVGSRRDFWAAMRRDAERGRTVLFATHYLEEADAFADRIVMIADGQVVADGDTAQIRARACGRVVSAEMSETDFSAALSAVPEIMDADRRGGRHYFTVADSDALVRFLLTRTRAREIEVVARGLEDAFIALTSDAQASGAPNVQTANSHVQKEL